jgi:hypothetical protein
LSDGKEHVGLSGLKRWGVGSEDLIIFLLPNLPSSNSGNFYEELMLMVPFCLYNIMVS